MPDLISFSKSPLEGKKIKIVFDNPKMTFHFGSDVSQTYSEGATKQKRENYLKRHKASGKENWTEINPASLSAKILWGKHQSINKNLKDYMKEFNINDKRKNKSFKGSGEISIDDYINQTFDGNGIGKGFVSPYTDDDEVERIYNIVGQRAINIEQEENYRSQPFVANQRPPVPLGQIQVPDSEGERNVWNIQDSRGRLLQPVLPDRRNMRDTDINTERMKQALFNYTNSNMNPDDVRIIRRLVPNAQGLPNEQQLQNFNPNRRHKSDGTPLSIDELKTLTRSYVNRANQNPRTTGETEEGLISILNEYRSLTEPSTGQGSKVKISKNRTVPSRYVPRSLSKEDREKQIKSLLEGKDRPKVDYKVKRSGWVKKFEDKYGKKITNEKWINDNLLKKEGQKQILRKAFGAYYSSGSRPNVNIFQWGYGRLGSALLGGKAKKLDQKILDKYKVKK